ncbi:GAF domain-containing protein [Tunicatimonas pelagia]|uniref:GAF domain-containing protein n=1 Tax=Tunicatimonas pelagia TaxID=931531 RepID=UPI002664EA67|nr:GAF domain-containing protein [Tunicatimonas pelagia]WKN45453.1 GAF domain-containing protein [Tunicatimonas pelagia]
MKVRNFFQKNSTFIPIQLTLGLIVISSLLTFYGKYQAQQFDDVKERVERVDKMMNYVQTHRNNITKGTKAFLLVPDDKFLKPYEAAGKQFSDHFDTLQMLLDTQGFTEQDQLLKAKAKVKEYHRLMGEIITLKRQGNDSTALAIYKTDPGFPVWQACYDLANQVQEFEEELYTEARDRYQHHLYVTTVMQALLFLIGVPTLIFAIRQIRKSDKLRSQLFANLLRSRKTYLVNDQANDDRQSEQDSIEYIISDLKTASKFINRIAEGDYSVTWADAKGEDQTNNEDNLADVLANMREQMKAVKEKDRQQLWITEGTSKVAEITRTHQGEPQRMADQLLSYLVKYTDSNQGSLFFLNEEKADKQHLTLVASYAYDKKKHEEKIIKIGQGLVGQTYLEKKTTLLKNIPDQYVAVTSGLGEATPSSLLLVPLMFNEKVMGVLELASFTTWPSYQIHFLENVGEIIASAIATLDVNVKTKQLLEQSQQATEEMRAQEEEMRQNMEELQATQEEMQRKTQEYETIIKELRAQIG